MTEMSFKAKTKLLLRTWMDKERHLFSNYILVVCMTTALTFSPTSVDTFRLVSISHLLPSNIRLTPADAFWETQKIIMCSLPYFALKLILVLTKGPMYF